MHDLFGPTSRRFAAEHRLVRRLLSRSPREHPLVKRTVSVRRWTAAGLVGPENQAPTHTTPWLIPTSSKSSSILLDLIGPKTITTSLCSTPKAASWRTFAWRTQ